MYVVAGEVAKSGKSIRILVPDNEDATFLKANISAASVAAPSTQGFDTWG